MQGIAWRVVALAVAVLFTVNANGEPASVTPLPNAHAHNDYLHSRPLFDALDHGFTSVEADVFPIGGELLVAHVRGAVKPERTLDKLYLAPLAERIEHNQGSVYPGEQRFFLLIDIKENPQEAYRLLKESLAKYSKLLTVVDDGKIHPGAITVVLTGEKPALDATDPAPRNVGLDGRISDLESKTPASFMPMISDAWPAHFKWRGSGPMPASERTQLQAIVKQAHASGRVVRFWATPEKEEVWRELRAADVDLISTDALDRAAAFLKSPDSQKHDSN